MDTIASNINTESGTLSIYVITLIIAVVLFIIQRYSYFIDRYINKLESKNGKWTGKPWPLISGLLIGVTIFLFGVFIPGDLTINPLNWQWPEITIAILSLVTIIVLLVESSQHFERKYALTRFFIWLILAVAYCIAGVLMGLILATIMALSIIIYFIFFWKKRLTIK